MMRFHCKKYGCRRWFTTHNDLNKHRKDHLLVTPAYTPPPVVREHVSFISLVRDTQWGRDYPKYGKKQPSDNEIMMGLLALIVENLEGIRKELRRDRVIKSI